MKYFTEFVVVYCCIFCLNVSAQQAIRIDTSFYSQALDTIKMVDVWLPADFYQSTNTDYPVIIYLHGAGGDQNESEQFANTYYTRYYQDTLHADSVSPAIIVSPDGSCEPYLGSFWVNSDLYGDYEEYVVTDLIDFVQTNFRVMNDKNFRFITGYSMGGFGSTYLAISHPDLFRGCAPSSAAHLSYPDTLMNEWIYRLNNENGGYHFNYNAGPVSKLFFTASGGFVPNLNIEPNYFELLWDTLGNMVDTVFNKWKNFDCCNLIHSLTPQDRLSFFLTCGMNDIYLCYPPYLQISDSLLSLGIDFQTYYHNSNHGIFNSLAHEKMSHWMDSLIADSYYHLDIEELLNHSRTKLKVYPNPFSQVMTIEYETGEAKKVFVTILNQLGQVVDIVEDVSNPALRCKFTWNASGLPVGVYFVQIRAGHEMNTVKIIKH